jgi:SAM-dependent methyltransferase
MYLAGRAVMVFLSRRKIDWYKREFFCQTKTYGGFTYAIGRLVRFVEQYDYGRLPEAERAKYTFEFWSGEAGARWHRERHTQAQDDFVRHRQECTRFLAEALPPGIGRMIEIGSGNAEALSHFKQHLNRPLRYIGVDISADTIKAAKAAHPDIESVCDDVFAHLRRMNDLSDSVVVSRWTAVYFTNAQMRDLIEIIRDRRGLAYFCENHYHRLGTGVASVYSGARKNSHDYPAMLKAADFAILKEGHYQPIGEAGLLRILARPT